MGDVTCAMTGKAVPIIVAVYVLENSIGQNI